jgi:hypothetical protein
MKVWWAYSASRDQGTAAAAGMIARMCGLISLRDVARSRYS